MLQRVARGAAAVEVSASRASADERACHRACYVRGGPQAGAVTTWSWRTAWRATERAVDDARGRATPVAPQQVLYFFFESGAWCMLEERLFTPF